MSFEPSIQILHGDCREVLLTLAENSLDALVTDPPAGIGFMNQDWDKNKGGPEQWRFWMMEVMGFALRALKPGAHALVWALPRTSHWTGIALENAGFEIRDVVTHHFGSGFPKSMNIAKAIEKHLGNDLEVVGVAPHGGPKFNFKAGAIPDNGGFNDVERKEYPVTSVSSDKAKHWDGWGTALKPGTEHWILCRKPIDESSIAANVLAHGTGGINIDGTRLDGAADSFTDNRQSKNNDVYGKFNPIDYDGSKGRWPANLLLTHSQACGLYCADDCPVKKLGEEAQYFALFPFEFLLEEKPLFIYCPKPTVEEKERGLADFEPRTVNDGRQTEIDNPYQRGETSRKNTHPTVKSIRLMDYLIRLVTPPGGKVLDCFMGSGTTGVASIKGGWSFVGIEQSEEFYSISQARLADALENYRPSEATHQGVKPVITQLSLL